MEFIVVVSDTEEDLLNSWPEFLSFEVLGGEVVPRIELARAWMDIEGNYQLIETSTANWNSDTYGSALVYKYFNIQDESGTSVLPPETACFDPETEYDPGSTPIDCPGV